jgi:diguanylate cyclase (GGDEF)-like protein
MSDPNFIKGETLQILRNHGLVPRNIVFEITERHSIKNFNCFKQIVENYRSQGYRIAIDDVGAGFSGLQTIAEIRPDFIKIDMSLIRNIDSVSSRQAVVAALTSLAENINCKIVAEGIESQNELNALLLKGVHYAQGYYLARPQFPKPAVAGKIITYIRHRKITDHAGRRRYLCIGDLAVPAPVVSEETPVAKVKELLDASRESDSSVVVLKEQLTVGLVMRHNLHRILSSQYGVSLYYHRPVTTVMEHVPLALESHTVLEVAAELALSRDRDKLYNDLVVVATDKTLVGVVSIQRLLETLTRVQMEYAKGTNPLTGLPGNLAIGEELSRRARQAPNNSVIYIDLDNFKSYNDTFGFKHGDQMILLLSKIILHCTQKYGGEEDFVGHIGGDDLIVITRPECAELICRQIVRLFDRMVGRRFSAADRARRAFYGYDRFGTLKWLPLTTVTLAIIECRNQEDYGSLAETAAQLKKHAKAAPGSNYMRDRRARGEYPEVGIPAVAQQQTPL